MGLKHSNWITAGSQPTNGMVLAFDASANEARMRLLQMPVSVAFTQPAVGGSVNVTVSYIVGVAAGQVVHIANTSTGATHGYYTVDSVNTTTNVLGLTRLQHTGTSTSTGGTVSANTSLVTVAGRPGADGATGATGSQGIQGPTGATGPQGATGPAGTNGFSATGSTTASFTQPVIGSEVSVNVSVGLTTVFSVGSIIRLMAIANGSTVGTYRITNHNSATNVSLLLLGYTGAVQAPTSTVATGAIISAAGLKGDTGTAGATVTPMATLTNSFTQPAVGSTVSATISKTDWLIEGMIIEIAGSHFYQVASVTSSTVVVLTNLGYSGSAAPGAAFSTGLSIGISGKQGPAGANGANGATGATGTAGANGATGATGPAGPQIPGLVRGATELTRATIVTTLLQDLPSGFYSINATSLADAQAKGMPIGGAGWCYVLVNHHENASANSGTWCVRNAWQLGTYNRWIQEVQNNSGSTQYGVWHMDYFPPQAMSSATWQARDVDVVFRNKTSGALERSSLGALKWMLSQSTTSIPSQGGTPTSAFTFDVSSYFVENTDVAAYAGSTPIKTYSVVSGPANLTINSTSGVITWPSPVGSYTGSVVIGSTDVMGEIVTNSFTITISAAANNAPVLPDFSFPVALVGLPYYFELPTATDSDGPNALIYSLTGTLPSGLFYTELNSIRWVSGTARGGTGGTASLTYSVSDGINTTSRTKTLTTQGCSDYRDLTEFSGNTTQIIWELVANTSSTAVAPDGAWRIRRFASIVEANQRLALGQFNFDFVKVQNNSFAIGNRVTGSNNPDLLAQSQNPSNYPSEAGIFIISAPLNGSNQIQTYNWVRVDSCGYIVETGTHTVAGGTVTTKRSESTNPNLLQLTASLVNGKVQLTNTANPSGGYYKLMGYGAGALSLQSLSGINFPIGHPIYVEYHSSQTPTNAQSSAAQTITLYNY